MAESEFSFLSQYNVTDYRQLRFLPGSMPLNLSKSSDEEFEMYCETCNREGNRIIACAFCVSCFSYFCRSCLKSHEKFLLGHKYVEGQDIPKDICMEKCKVHCREIVKFYCEKCCIFACILCKRERHGGQCSMKYLPHFVKDIEKEEDFKDILMKKEILSKRLEDMKFVNDTKQMRLRNLSSTTKTAIENEKQILLSEFDKELEQIEANIKSQNDNYSKKMTTVRRKTIYMSSKIDKLIGDVKKISVSPKSEKYKLFIEMKQLRKEIKDNEYKDEYSYSSGDDEFESDVMESMNTLTERVQRFGLYMRKYRDRYQESEDGLTKTAIHIEDINIKVASDVKDCFVVDCFLISDEYLVVCDKNNKRIKLVNLKSNRVSFVRQLWTVPEGVARLDDSKFVVVRQHETDKERSVIQFLTFTDHSKPPVFQKRKLLTEMYCCAIAYYERNKLIISMSKNHEGKIQILNTEGHIFKNFELDTESETRIFRGPFSITVDRDEELAYISDWYKDKVFIIDLDDHTCTEISAKVWHPRGVATDEDRFVFIVESGTNSIQYVDTDGEMKKVLVESQSEDFRPFALSYSIRENKLYVGQERQNCIKVYNVNDG